jgi:hypothetical protein
VTAPENAVKTICELMDEECGMAPRTCCSGCSRPGDSWRLFIDLEGKDGRGAVIAN